MLGLGMSVLIKEAWNSLCSGRNISQAVVRAVTLIHRWAPPYCNCKAPTGTPIKLEQKRRIQVHSCCLLPNWGHGKQTDMPPQTHYREELRLSRMTHECSQAGGSGRAGKKLLKGKGKSLDARTQAETKIHQEVDSPSSCAWCVNGHRKLTVHKHTSYSKLLPRGQYGYPYFIVSFPYPHECLVCPTLLSTARNPHASCDHVWSSVREEVKSWWRLCLSVHIQAHVVKQNCTNREEPWLAYLLEALGW